MKELCDDDGNTSLCELNSIVRVFDLKSFNPSYCHHTFLFFQINNKIILRIYLTYVYGQHEHSSW